MKQESGEHFRVRQFADRLRGHLERWIELGGIDKSYDQVLDLVVSEQIPEVADRDLALFLKERKQKSLVALTEIADQYLEAHSWGRKAVSTKPKSSQSSQPTSSTSERPHANRHCYHCGKMGHIAANCRQKGLTDSASKTFMPKSSKPKVSPPKVGAAEVSSGASSGPTQTGATCVEVDAKPCGEVTLNQMSTGVGKALPQISAAYTLEQSMPVLQGQVGSQPVTALRDTSCALW